MTGQPGVRRSRAKWLLAAIGVALLLPVVGLVALGELTGEVVVLRTRDVSGSEHRTRLWIVEHDGALWLRAGGRATGSDDSWYARLIARPEVTVVRGGEEIAARAVPAPEARAAIDARMRSAYSVADRAVLGLRGLLASSSEETSMPVRLDPRDAPTR